jgi:hypothetical protein
MLTRGALRKSWMVEGQHALMAVVESGKTWRLHVTFNADAGARDNTVNLPRRPHDLAALALEHPVSRTQHQMFQRFLIGDYFAIQRWEREDAT